MDYGRHKEAYQLREAHGEQKASETMGVTRSTIRRYIRRYRSGSDKEFIPEVPKILLFDIETVPMKVFVWGLKQHGYISPVMIDEDWNVVSWAAKWLCDSTVVSDIQTPEEAVARDDSRILKEMWRLMDEADIVIAHNGDNFDIKKLNTRFLIHKMGPPSPYKSIDTLKISRKMFAPSSHSLNFIVKMLSENKEKIKTDIDLWKSCLKGDEKALKYMRKYNKKDVFLLEDVYIEFRPWIKPHPNLGVYVDSENPVCPTCTSEDIHEKGSPHATAANRYQSYVCNSCHSYSKSLSGMLDITARRNLMRSMPK